MIDLPDTGSAPVLSHRDQILCALDQCPDTGEIIELGVHRGNSIKLIAKHVAPRTVWGFDSFAGLPEPWELSSKSTRKAGHFKCSPPECGDNVRLVEGFFDVSLPAWIQQHNPPSMAFVHIDSDLYSSALCALTVLDPLIQAGTIIVFDELVDWRGSDAYPYWPDGEWKALQEWTTEFDRQYEFISREHQFAAAIRITA